MEPEVYRQLINLAHEGRTGVLSNADFIVTQNGTPNMSVNVAAGRIWIPGTSLSSINPGGGAYYPQGHYFAENDATVNLPISASDPSDPRIDLIVAQVQDATYVGATNSAQLTAIVGNPTPGATLSNLLGVANAPVSSLGIGVVLVPAGATSIVTADLWYFVSLASRATGVWVNSISVGGAWGATAFSARPVGDVVELSGSYTVGVNWTANATIANLPTSLRPSVTRYVLAAAITGGGTVVPQYLTITTGGAISSATAIASGSTLSLDGRSFRLV